MSFNTSILEDETGSSPSVSNISKVGSTSTKTTLLGVKNAQRRLKAFSIQKKKSSVISNTQSPTKNAPTNNSQVFVGSKSGQLKKISVTSTENEVTEKKSSKKHKKESAYEHMVKQLNEMKQSDDKVRKQHEGKLKDALELVGLPTLDKLRFLKTYEIEMLVTTPFHKNTSMLVESLKRDYMQQLHGKAHPLASSQDFVVCDSWPQEDERSKSESDKNSKDQNTGLSIISELYSPELSSNSGSPENPENLSGDGNKASRNSSNVTLLKNYFRSDGKLPKKSVAVQNVDSLLSIEKPTSGVHLDKFGFIIRDTTNIVLPPVNEKKDSKEVKTSSKKSSEYKDKSRHQPSDRYRSHYNNNDRNNRRRDGRRNSDRRRNSKERDKRGHYGRNDSRNRSKESKHRSERSSKTKHGTDHQQDDNTKDVTKADDNKKERMSSNVKDDKDKKIVNSEESQVSTKEAESVELDSQEESTSNLKGSDSPKILTINEDSEITPKDVAEESVHVETQIDPRLASEWENSQTPTYSMQSDSQWEKTSTPDYSQHFEEVLTPPDMNYGNMIIKDVWENLSSHLEQQEDQFEDLTPESEINVPSKIECKEDSVDESNKNSEEKPADTLDENVNYWQDVSDACGPYYHSNENCYRKTKTEPVISYCENIRRCGCRSLQDEQFDKLSLNAEKIVQKLLPSDQPSSIENETPVSKRDWYPDENSALTEERSAIPPSSIESNWDKDEESIPEEDSKSRDDDSKTSFKSNKKDETKANLKNGKDAKPRTIIPDNVLTTNQIIFDVTKEHSVSSSNRKEPIVDVSLIPVPIIEPTIIETSVPSLDLEYEKFMEAVGNELSMDKFENEKVSESHETSEGKSPNEKQKRSEPIERSAEDASENDENKMDKCFDVSDMMKNVGKKRNVEEKVTEKPSKKKSEKKKIVKKVVGDSGKLSKKQKLIIKKKKALAAKKRKQKKKVKKRSKDTSSSEESSSYSSSSCESSSESSSSSSSSSDSTSSSSTDNSSSEDKSSKKKKILLKKKADKLTSKNKKKSQKVSSETKKKALTKKLKEGKKRTKRTSISSKEGKRKKSGKVALKKGKVEKKAVGKKKAKISRKQVASKDDCSSDEDLDSAKVNKLKKLKQKKALEVDKKSKKLKEKKKLKDKKRRKTKVKSSSSESTTSSSSESSESSDGSSKSESSEDKKKSKKRKKKVVRADNSENEDSVSKKKKWEEDESFSMETLNNIKQEKMSDEEMVTKPAEKNQQLLPRPLTEIISVNELHQEFVQSNKDTLENVVVKSEKCEGVKDQNIVADCNVDSQVSEKISDCESRSKPESPTDDSLNNVVLKPVVLPEVQEDASSKDSGESKKSNASNSRSSPNDTSSPSAENSKTSSSASAENSKTISPVEEVLQSSVHSTQGSHSGSERLSDNSQNTGDSTQSKEFVQYSKDDVYTAKITRPFENIGKKDSDVVSENVSKDVPKKIQNLEVGDVIKKHIVVFSDPTKDIIQSPVKKPRYTGKQPLPSTETEAELEHKRRVVEELDRLKKEFEEFRRQKLKFNDSERQEAAEELKRQFDMVESYTLSTVKTPVTIVEKVDKKVEAQKSAIADIRPIPTVTGISTSAADGAMVEEGLQGEIKWDWRPSNNTAGSTASSSANRKPRPSRWGVVPKDNTQTNSTLIEVPIRNENEIKSQIPSILEMSNTHNVDGRHLDMMSEQEMMQMQAQYEAGYTNLEDDGIYSIPTISSSVKVVSRGDSEAKYEMYSEAQEMGYVALPGEEVHDEEKESKQISLDERISLVLQFPANAATSGAGAGPVEETAAPPSPPQLPPSLALRAPPPIQAKGILVLGHMDTKSSTKCKKVCFSDGLAPGMDSDLEEYAEPPLKKAKTSKSTKRKCGGHGYPCPPNWPDYHSYYDTLPPPPPPPGSPPLHLMESRCSIAANNLLQPPDIVTRLPKIQSHNETPLIV